MFVAGFVSRGFWLAVAFCRANRLQILRNEQQQVLYIRGAEGAALGALRTAEEDRAPAGSSPFFQTHASLL